MESKTVEHSDSEGGGLESVRNFKDLIQGLCTSITSKVCQEIPVFNGIFHLDGKIGEITIG